ncbi:MAG: hypothetical protein H6679_01075 [Epsilonproteobacteria bacterium]|nr:hypothetical protein [Campylobacterota bacterium]
MDQLYAQDKAQGIYDFYQDKASAFCVDYVKTPVEQYFLLAFVQERLKEVREIRQVYVAIWERKEEFKRFAKIYQKLLHNYVDVIEKRARSFNIITHSDNLEQMRRDISKTVEMNFHLAMENMLNSLLMRSRL